jgi:hypothetical protein
MLMDLEEMHVNLSKHDVSETRSKIVQKAAKKTYKNG